MPVSIFGSTINGGSARGAGRLVFKTTAVVEALNMNGKAIKNLPFPNVETDAVNKQYVDDKINNLDDELKQYINSVIEEKVNRAIESLVGVIKNN